MGFQNELEETNENEGYPKSPFISTSPPFKKKILAERDPNAHLDATPKEKSLIQEIHPLRVHSIFDSSYSVPYDPVNNFTSPRPAFLRYNPDRRKEILLRMRNEEVSVSGSEISQDQENSFEEDLDSISSDLSLEDVEPDGDEEEEVQERRPWCSRMVWILLLLGVLLLSHLFLFPMSSPSGPSRQNNLITTNSMYRDLLKAHMGLSDMCLDIGEGICDFAVSDGSVMDHLGDSGEIDGVEVAAEKDKIFVDEVNLDEVGAVQDSDEEESIDEIEVVREKDAIFMDEVNVEELMAEKRTEEPITSYESPEQEEILGDQAIENFSKSVEGPDDQFVFDEAEDEESESLLIPEFESVEGSTDESELSTVDETLSWWKLGFELAFDDVLLLLASLSLLAVITGLLIGLSVYLARPHHKLLLMPSPSHNFLPSDKPVDEKMTSITSKVNPSYSSYKHKEPVPAPKMEELRTEGKCSYATPLSPSYSGAGLCATRPPTVELLGEFSIVDAVPDRTMGSKGYTESEFSKTEGSRRVEIKSSPYSSKVHPFQAAEYTSLRSYTLQERPEKREVSLHAPTFFSSTQGFDCVCSILFIVNCLH